MPTNLLDPPEGLKYMELTPEKVNKLWKISNETSGVLNDLTRGRFDLFLIKLADKNSVWLELPDNQGVVYAEGVVPGMSCWVHFSFWDRKLVGKRDLLNRCLKWIVNAANLVKVNVWIPAFCKNMKRFVTKLGFVYEGTIRNWAYDRGKPYNIMCYGMTREEVLYGRFLSTRTTDNKSNKSNGSRPNDEGAVSKTEHSPTS